jgi:hypothetical protein
MVRKRGKLQRRMLISRFVGHVTKDRAHKLVILYTLVHNSTSHGDINVSCFIMFHLGNAKR